MLLDADLAALYGVSTKRLNEQVRRNTDRFPADFMFRLSTEETAAMRSQFVTSTAPVALFHTTSRHPIGLLVAPGSGSTDDPCGLGRRH